MKTLYQFGAKWCQPCKTVKPVAESTAKELGVEFEYIDIDTCADLAISFNVRSLPTFVVMDDCEEVARAQGVLTASALRALML